MQMYSCSTAWIKCYFRCVMKLLVNILAHGGNQDYIFLVYIFFFFPKLLYIVNNPFPFFSFLNIKWAEIMCNLYLFYFIECLDSLQSVVLYFCLKPTNVLFIHLFILSLYVSPHSVWTVSMFNLIWWKLIFSFKSFSINCYFSLSLLHNSAMSPKCVVFIWSKKWVTTAKSKMFLLWKWSLEH